MSWLQSPLAKAFDLDNKNYSELRQEIVSLGGFFKKPSFPFLPCWAGKPCSSV